MVEFKSEKVHPNSLAEEIVAFSNFEGGTLLIGIDDEGGIEGCKRVDIEEFVINVCRNNINPSILPVIERVVVEDKSVLVVTILRGDTAHSTNRGQFFIRVGSTKQSPTQQELIRLFQKRNIFQFDETPVLKATIQSIDIGKVNNFLKKLGQRLLDEESNSSLANELINLSILIDVEGELHPSLGGLLAFGKNPQKYFPSYTLLCGAYKGDDFISDTVREKELTGTFDELIEDAIAFLKLVIPHDSTLEDGIRRKDRYLYPIEALREGIVNAVCHRDYTISGSAIRLFVFNNRIELRSPGGLPNTLTLESILYRQFARNQTIASFLTGYGYMERRGKGILRMKEICRENGILCQFALSPDNGEFVVTYSDRIRDEPISRTSEL